MAVLLQAKITYSGNFNAGFFQINANGALDLNALAGGGTASVNAGYENGHLNAQETIGAAALFGITDTTAVQIGLNPQGEQVVHAVQEIAAAASNPVTTSALPWLWLQLANGGH